MAMSFEKRSEGTAEEAQVQPLEQRACDTKNLNQMTKTIYGEVARVYRNISLLLWNVGSYLSRGTSMFKFALPALVLQVCS
jgi:hypothetical protein